MAIPEHHLSLEEFLQLPEDEPPLEYDDGVVVQKVSPKARHSRLQYTLAERINHFAEPRRLASAFPELRVSFSRRSYVPDLAVYTWDRIPVDDSGEFVEEFPTPPEIAVEIVSPEQRVTRLVRRCLWYVAHDVRIALLVDPDDRTILVFRPDQVPQELRGSDDIDLDEVLPGFELTVEELFGSLRKD